MILSPITEIRKGSFGHTIFRDRQELQLSYNELVNLAEYIVLNVMDFGDYRKFISQDWYTKR